jgi:hypothetical protein
VVGGVGWTVVYRFERQRQRDRHLKLEGVVRRGNPQGSFTAIGRDMIGHVPGGAFRG